jgi:diaminohydroxyphosphoribosylaminopyrimidine deaminase / 5-amino-6-(5-phosphoribosylamino)uracil reductase
VSSEADSDRRMMGRALRRARRGRPGTHPHAGAVLVRDGRVLAEGHRQAADGPHAETAALRRAGDGARGATLYVTLEPCGHGGGRTPACTDALIEAGVARVVVGCPDPSAKAAGALEHLRAAGVRVDVGVRRDEAEALIADFAKHHRTGLPHVTLKAAVTLDGRMATPTGDSQWITGERARRHGHRLRDRSDAVMVGVGTVVRDDPRLTVRMVRGRDPLRAVVDTHLRTGDDARVLAGDTARTVIFHGPDAAPGRRTALDRAGAELVEVPVRGGRLDLEAVLRELGRRDVVRLLGEGGPTLHGAFLDSSLADRAAVFVAPRIVGAAAAPTFAAGEGVRLMADAWRLVRPRVQRLGLDVLFEGALERGEGS